MPVRPTRGSAAEHVPSRGGATKREKAERVAICVAFAFYATFMLKLLFFSRAPGSERSVNLVPFSTIAGYVSSASSGTGRIAFVNVVGNVAIFVPLGLFASWRRHRRAPWRSMLAVAATSVGVEILQGVLAVGASDIDDVILNSVGGLIGILALELLWVIFGERARVRSALAVLSLLTVPLWCFFLFVIQLRI